MVSSHFGWGSYPAQQVLDVHDFLFVCRGLPLPSRNKAILFKMVLMFPALFIKNSLVSPRRRISHDLSPGRVVELVCSRCISHLTILPLSISSAYFAPRGESFALLFSSVWDLRTLWKNSDDDEWLNELMDGDGTWRNDD